MREESIGRTDITRAILQYSWSKALSEKPQVNAYGADDIYKDPKRRSVLCSDDVR